MIACIAASLLNADASSLGQEAKDALDAGADRLHLDIMDQHYVPFLSVGPGLCQSLRNHCIHHPIDVHLMTRPALNLAEQFMANGATSITCHTDCGDNLATLLKTIEQRGGQAGLAINPDQSWEDLKPHLDHLDRATLMTVQPGRGGQTLLEACLDQAAACQAWMQQHAPHITLELDGGIHAGNLQQIVRHTGITNVVVGSGIFGQTNYQAALNALKAPV